MIHSKEEAELILKNLMDVDRNGLIEEAKAYLKTVSQYCTWCSWYTRTDKPLDKCPVCKANVQTYQNRGTL